MGKLARNERRKLVATLLVGIALSLTTAIVVVPGARLVEHLGLAYVPAVLAAIVALVLMARRALERLED